MYKLRNYIRSLLHGEHSTNMQSSYVFILRSLFLLYLIYAFIFFIYGPYQLTILSFVCLFLMHINLHLFKSSRNVLCFILTTIELLSYALICTLFLKQDYGFSLYALAIIPLIYFVSFSLKKSGRNILNPIPLTVISCLVFISCKTIQIFNPIGYFSNIQILSITLYYMNSLLSMVCIIEVCKIFSKTTKTKQTALETKNTQLDFYANQDSLTKLQNRRYFELKLNESIEKANNGCYQFSMLMCDLDDFKQINDTYGHVLGDKVLQNVSHIIQTNIRNFDCAARWGGEEFIILIKGGIPIASLIADRINKAVAASIIPTELGEIHYTITIGVAEYTKGLSCNKIIEKADSNLYLGKRSGKNCVVC